MIDILFWAVITLLIIGPLLSIMMIGRPREPITPGLAVTGVIMNAVIIAILLLKVKGGSQ